MTQFPLSETGNVTLDGSGNGTVKLLPSGPNERWVLSTASVKATTAVAEAICRVYIGAKVSDSNFVDATLTGSTGDVTGAVEGREIAQRGDPAIFAVWAGGDVGATATLTVNGSKEFR